MFIYYCDDCGFEQWDVMVRPGLQCPGCGLYVNHNEIEGDEKDGTVWTNPTRDK